MLFKKKETDNKVAKVKDKKSDKKKTKESLALPKINPEVLRLFFKETDEKSGIMRIDDTHYSICYEYSDISFSKASPEVQESIFLKYVDFLNSHSVNEHIQIVHTSTILETKDYKNRFIYTTNETASDNEKRIAEEFNELITNVIGHQKETLCETRLIVITVEAETLDDAKDLFMAYQIKLEEKFKLFGSKVRKWTIQERLEFLYNIFNINTLEQDYPDCKNILQQYVNEDINVYDFLAPKEDMNFREKDYIVIGDKKYIKVMYLDKLNTSITPKLYNQLTTIKDANIIVTENIIGKNPAKVIYTLNKKISGMKDERLKKVKRANKNHYDYALVRDEKLEAKLEDAIEFRTALTKKKQKSFATNLLVCIIAESEKELSQATDKVNKIAGENIVTMGTLDWQQLEGLLNLLPFGFNTLQFQRSLTSEATAAFVPFNTKQWNSITICIFSFVYLVSIRHPF